MKLVEGSVPNKGSLPNQDRETGSSPRLAPDHPLPPYSYVAGQFPHPESDPEGHSYGQKRPAPDFPSVEEWQQCQCYLIGLDLFNHGYYWEAHEYWEALWQAVERRGTLGAFFKGLIKLAAAGVKARERVTEGVQNHARRARELFQKVAKETSGPYLMGLLLDELIAFAEQIEKQPILGQAVEGTPVEIVFQSTLRPHQEGEEETA